MVSEGRGSVPLAVKLDGGFLVGRGCLACGLGEVLHDMNMCCLSWCLLWVDEVVF